ncbi:MAG TPA: GNAT family N-acetyltransferase [Candidatus Saccharimonadales bacterium]|nr:GNAT family N-acetyltransferase [Candidatus Saccharimonadales bacterium]
MDVIVSTPTSGDAGDFIAAARASRTLHQSWIEAPDSEARFAGFLLLSGRDDHVAYLLRHTSCGELVGYANVSNIVRGAFQSAYLGYGAFASHAGRGLMTQGLRLVIDTAFGELGLHRLEANIQPANARSLALVQRLGFQKEGYSPRYLRLDGDWRDHERWALSTENWPRSQLERP